METVNRFCARCEAHRPHDAEQHVTASITVRNGVLGQLQTAMYVCKCHIQTIGPSVFIAYPTSQVPDGLDTSCWTDRYPEPPEEGEDM